MDRRIAKFVQDAWAGYSPTDAEGYRLALYGMMSEMLIARRRLKFALMFNWYEALRHGATMIGDDEERASSFDHWYACALQFMSDAAMAFHKEDDAFPALGEAWRLLEVKDARRAAAGLPLRHSTEARWRILGTLSDLKWRDKSDFHRNYLFPIEEHFRLFPVYFARVREWHDSLPKTPDSLVQRRIAEESLLSTGIMVAGCALRYESGQLPAILDAWNSFYFDIYGSELLTGTPGDWRTMPHPPIRNVWYWQFEIIKEWANGSMETADVDPLYDGMLGSLGRRGMPYSDEFFMLSLVRDREWMRSALRRQARGLLVLSPDQSDERAVS